MKNKYRILWNGVTRRYKVSTLGNEQWGWLDYSLHRYRFLWQAKLVVRLAKQSDKNQAEEEARKKMDSMESNWIIVAEY
jgi:hypothetical protein